MPEDAPRPDRCGTCRFWHQFTEDAGECRRRSPLPRLTTEPDDAKRPVEWPCWPNTLDDAWCGEWEGKSPSAAGPATAKNFEDFVWSLSFRGRNALLKLGVKSPEELLALKYDTVWLMKSVGESTLREIAKRCKDEFGRYPAGWERCIPGPGRR